MAGQRPQPACLNAGMDPRQVLAAFDEQIRRHPRLEPDTEVERDSNVVRVIARGDGWNGVVWSDLADADADAVIATQASRFADLGRSWEWKHYSYDRPIDLPRRLRACGLTPEPAETLLLAELDKLVLDEPAPEGVELVSVADARGVDALVHVHDEVFGGDHSAVGRTVLTGLAEQPSSVQAVVAMAGEEAVCAGRVEFHAGTDFASLWGGGTLPAWRGRGVFRSLVAHRAAAALDRGYRYLQVDASPDSRPVLERMGFVAVAATTPFLSGTPGGPQLSLRVPSGRPPPA